MGKKINPHIKDKFPDMQGVSEINLVYMQTFATSYLLQIALVSPAQFEKKLTIELLANLSWYHHKTILDKVKDLNPRPFLHPKVSDSVQITFELPQQIIVCREAEPRQ